MLINFKYMVPNEDQKMVLAMKHYGGGFVQALATCFVMADEINYAKLLAAFPEYCEQYRKMSEKPAWEPSSLAKQSD